MRRITGQGQASSAGGPEDDAAVDALENRDERGSLESTTGVSQGADEPDRLAPQAPSRSSVESP